MITHTMLRLPLRPLLTLGHTGLVIRANISSASSASSSISQIFVDNPVDIKLVLDACYHADSVALDTEFVQFPALVPRLQLVQIATPTLLAAIDYRMVHRQCLLDLFKAIGDRQLVVHGGKTDLRLIGHLTGKIPPNVFDTQVASGIVGMGQNLNLGKLVEKLTGVVLDKSMTLTDWSLRPLSSAQIVYALNDVRYLLEMRDTLWTKIKECSRDQLFEEEMEKLADPEIYKPLPPDQCWREIRRAYNLSGQALAILRELAAWRDVKSRELNRQPGLLFRDETLRAIAVQAPQTLSDLKCVQSVSAAALAQYSTDILTCVRKGLQCPEHDWPVRADYDRIFNDQEQTMLLCLQAWLKSKSDELGIASSIIAPDQNDIKQLAITPCDLWDSLDNPILRGWRKDLVGNDLLDIKSGRKALRYDPGQNVWMLENVYRQR